MEKMYLTFFGYPRTMNGNGTNLATSTGSDDSVYVFQRALNNSYYVQKGEKTLSPQAGTRFGR
jgi:hypothetical protein